MGIKKEKGARAIYGNQGRWRLSHTVAVEQAWSLRWFKDRGLKTVSGEKRPHWLPLEVWFELS